MKRSVRNGVFGKTLWREKVDWQMKAFQTGKTPWAMALEVSAEFVLQGESNWFNWSEVILNLDFPGGSNCKESACNAGDRGLIPALGSPSGEGDGNPLQYSCLENSMNRETWRAIVRGVAKSRTRLSDQHTYTATSSAVWCFSPHNTHWFHF